MLRIRAGLLVLALGLAGCMAVDVADILQKGRHRLTSLVTSIVAERAPEPNDRLQLPRSLWDQILALPTAPETGAGHRGSRS